MVFALIIHHVNADECIILYSRYFNQENSYAPCDTESSLSLQKQKLIIVADIIQSEYVFRKAASGRSVDLDLMRLNNESILPDFELGFVRLPMKEPFMKEKVCFWLAAANCCFTMVLEKYENHSAAENVLKLIIKHLQESTNILNNAAEAMLKVDVVETIVDKFLPGGQLLFMNHRLIRQLSKELVIALK